MIAKTLAILMAIGLILSPVVKAEGVGEDIGKTLLGVDISMKGKTFNSKSFYITPFKTIGVFYRRAVGRHAVSVGGNFSVMDAYFNEPVLFYGVKYYSTYLRQVATVFDNVSYVDFEMSWKYFFNDNLQNAPFLSLSYALPRLKNEKGNYLSGYKLAVIAGRAYDGKPFRVQPYIGVQFTSISSVNIDNQSYPLSNAASSEAALTFGLTLDYEF